MSNNAQWRGSNSQEPRTTCAILDNAEPLITLTQAADCIPRHTRGRKVHSSTIWRWCREGYGPKRIALEYVMVGSRIYTSAEAVKRWILAQTEAAQNDKPSLPARTPKRRGRTPKQYERDQATARATLARHGLVYEDDHAGCGVCQSKGSRDN